MEAEFHVSTNTDNDCNVFFRLCLVSLFLYDNNSTACRRIYYYYYYFYFRKIRRQQALLLFIFFFRFNYFLRFQYCSKAFELSPIKRYSLINGVFSVGGSDSRIVIRKTVIESRAEIPRVTFSPDSDGT